MAIKSWKESQEDLHKVMKDGMGKHKAKALAKHKVGDITKESLAHFKASHPMSEAMKKDQIRRKLIGD